MSKFLEVEVGWACWASEAPTELIRVDAPASSTPVFLATHHDRKLREISIDALDRGEFGQIVGQKEMLHRFRDAPAPELMFVVLLGKSGTGKSHLVKWVESEIRRRHDSKDHVVYIAKTDMSLRRVIELTIEGMDGPAIERVRKELENVRRNVHEEIAPEQLAQFLAIAVNETRVEHRATDLRSYYDTVYNLVRDAVFVDRLSESPAFGSYARQVATGSRSASAEAFRFSEDILPMQEHLIDAARPAKDASARLLTREEERKSLAQILSDHLAAAVRKMVGLGDTNLLQLFSEVRGVLGSQGRRLLILIEDLTVLSGIEQDFADAITVPSTTGGELCELRVLAASTDENYYASPFWTKATVKTRTAASGRVFVLDQAWEDFGEEALSRFLGRYLNAVRIGVDGLARSFHEDAPDTSWVPNACQGCPQESSCRPVFGATPDGFSLYPFTGEALRRIRNLIGAEFDPRKLLAGTRDVLRDHRTDLLRGLFPPTHLESTFRKNPIQTGEGLKAVDRNRLRGLFGHEAPRYETFFSVWGYGSITRSVDPVAKAFDLETSPLDLSGDESVESTPESQAPPTTPDIVKEHDRLVEAIEAWGNGRTMPDSVAGRVRDAVHKHLTTLLDARGIFDDGTKWFDRVNGTYLSLHSVILKRAEGGGGAKAAWTVALDPDELEDVLFILGLAQYDELGHWHFEEGPNLLRLYVRRMNAWADELSNFVYRGSEDSPSILSDLGPLLLAGGAILGLSGGDTNPAQQLATALSSTPDDRERRDHWGLVIQKAVIDGQQPKGWDRTQLLREFVNRLGVRQGHGDYRAIDAVEAIRAMEQFPTDRLPEPRDNAPDEIRRYWTPISAAVEKALDIETSLLIREWMHDGNQIGRVAESESLIPDLLDAVEELVIEGEEAGILGGVRGARDWHDRNQDSSDWTGRLVDVTRRLSDLPELGYWERIAFLAEDNGPLLEHAAGVLKDCVQIVNSTKDNLQHQRRAADQDTGLHSQLHSVLEKISESLGRLESQ